MTLRRDVILDALSDSRWIRPKEINKLFNTTVSTTLTRLKDSGYIRRIKGKQYNETYYQITDIGITDICKSSRIRVLEELSKQNKQTPLQLKDKINKTASTVLTRMRRDNHITRDVNPSNLNQITYSITDLGFKVLNEFKQREAELNARDII